LEELRIFHHLQTTTIRERRYQYVGIPDMNTEPSVFRPLFLVTLERQISLFPVLPDGTLCHFVPFGTILAMQLSHLGQFFQIAINENACIPACLIALALTAPAFLMAVQP